MPRAKSIIATGAIALLALVPQYPKSRIGSFAISTPAGPFVSGSRLQIETSPASHPVAFSLLGPGSLDGAQFIAPMLSAPAAATIIAATPGALASRTIDIVPAPHRTQPLLAVATYESGIALHDPRTFALIGYVPIGGPPGDVAFDSSGNLFAPDTDGATMTRISRAPWQLSQVNGVPSGNEIAVDKQSGAVFVTDRDVGGKGALTRIMPDGSVSRVITGDTAEGLVIDAARGLVYAGNVNDNRIAEVRASTMTIVRSIPSVQRTFGLALDEKHRRLYAVSNNSPSMQKGGGYVAAIDLRKSDAPIVRRSSTMTFPLGAAFDPQTNRLFVTDEAADKIYVLDGRNLRTAHPALSTCRTPWRPLIAAGRLYVPCARADRVDVFDLRTLRRVSGAPFVTGGFPLAVALWH
jgi:DNA-binding beta-propeller fold protein YncE